MTRKKLIELGRKIMNSSFSEDQINEWMIIFDKNVPHPKGSSLFFWPENYNSRRDDISKYKPTVEEVVDKALSYKPIEL